MGLFEHFPYTNFHELNLDHIVAWISDIKPAIKKMLGWPINATDNSDGLAFGKEATESQLVDSAWSIKTDGDVIADGYLRSINDGSDRAGILLGYDEDQPTRGVSIYAGRQQINNRYYANRLIIGVYSYDSVTGEQLNTGEVYRMPIVNADRTGTEGFIVWTSKDIPEPPTTDGSYTLTATVSNGVVTYSWQ